MSTQSEYTKAKIRQSVDHLAKKDSDARTSSDWFMNRYHPMDKLLPPYKPLYEELDVLYEMEDHPTLHAIADFLIKKISFSSYVWNESFLEEPFEKANRYFFSGYGTMPVFKPEVQVEIVKIILVVLPVRYISRQNVLRSVIGLKYKERFEW